MKGKLYGNLPEVAEIVLGFDGSGQDYGREACYEMIPDLFHALPEAVDRPR